MNAHKTLREVTPQWDILYLRMRSSVETSQERREGEHGMSKRYGLLTNRFLSFHPINSLMSLEERRDRSRWVFASSRPST
jgi:hypothetical protein